MTVLFFEKKSRQKKLQLSRSLYRFLIICTDGAHKRQKKLRLSGSFQAPLCKGSCRRKPTEGLFFYNLPTAARFPNPSRRGLQVCFAHLQIPPTAARFPNPSRRGLQACFAHSQIPPTAARFPNPSRRRLQACFAHSQIPLHKGAFLSIVLFFDLLSYLLSQKARLSGGLFVSLFCVCCGFFNRRFFGSFCGFL